MSAGNKYVQCKIWTLVRIASIKQWRIDTKIHYFGLDVYKELSHWKLLKSVRILHNYNWFVSNVF